jgi:hypothetical protein
MKLLSHNILRNNSSGVGNSVTGGYPLKITANEVRVTDNEYNELFTKNVLATTVDWKVLVEVRDPPSTLPARLRLGEGDMYTSPGYTHACLFGDL